MDYQRILLDIETQQDLFRPGYLAENTEAVTAQIYRLFDWAKEHHIPVMSTVLRVRPNEKGPLSDRVHCVEGTEGEQKLPGTILPHRINLGLRNSTDLPSDLFSTYQQIVFEKRDTDLFKHARAERLLTEMGPATFVICGAGIAQGIVQTAVGLRTRGFGVILARDAVLDFGHPLEPMAYLRMEAKGVVFADTSTVIEPQKKALRRAAFRTQVHVEK